MYTAEMIIKLLNTNNTAVERAMVCLYQRQTSEEKLNANTTIRNGMGFSGAHARL